MSDRIIAVTGLGRCGSTMAMHMLRAGGVDLYHDPGNDVSCETVRMLHLPEEIDWLAECKGKAVKILDPWRYQPPKAMKYDFIYCMRNPYEQAKSQLKFMASQGEAVRQDDMAVRAVSNALLEAGTATIRFLHKFPDYRLHLMNFETTLKNPDAEAKRLAEFLDLDTAEDMALAVHVRGSDCLPHMAENEMVEEMRCE